MKPEWRLGRSTSRKSIHKKFDKIAINIPEGKAISELLKTKENAIRKYLSTMIYLSKQIRANPIMVEYQDALLSFLFDNPAIIDFTVRKYAASVILDILQDILPDQKILVIDNKKGLDLTEDVKNTYKTEEIVLKFYLKYLKGLMQDLTEIKKKEERNSS